jgi:hypothetical protein
MFVRELELDLDAFEGPFDLLLTLVLREELDLAEVDVAGIIVAFIERLAEREELDLEACGEFLVLVAALLELKARGLFEEDADPRRARARGGAEELARRLEEYRRMKEAAAWLSERLAGERDRFFRLGPRRSRRSPSASSRRRSPSSSPRAAPARAGAAGRLARAHGASLPAGLAVRRALRALLAPRAASTSTRWSTGSRGRGRGRLPRAPRAAHARTRSHRAGRAVRADQDFPPRRRKDRSWIVRSA